MKTFQEFMILCEANYDPEIQGRSQIRRQGEGGRVGAERKKSAPEKRRMKAAGGGKMVPAKDYKPRKDIGTQRARSEREQQPTQERGSAALSPKEAQRKAYLERKAREQGKSKPSSASELLRKKKPTQKPVAGYTPPKASGKTKEERWATKRAGERKLRDLVLQATGKKTEAQLKHPITAAEVTRRNKEESKKKKS